MPNLRIYISSSIPAPTLRSSHTLPSPRWAYNRSQTSAYELIAFDGTRSTASVADLDLIFLNRRFRGRYLLTTEDTGVLGRDILNHLALIMDGPRNQWTERT